MNVHLALDGTWVRCNASTRACPRLYHLPNTTVAAARQMPMEFLTSLFTSIDPPTLARGHLNPADVWALTDPEKALDKPQSFFGGTGWVYLHPHRDHDLPAVVNKAGTIEWWHRGIRHRSRDRPAQVYPDGRREWWLHGQLHRANNPAIIGDEEKEWWWRGQRHREDGPALVYADGHQEWWVHDQRHREDGPAIIRIDGEEEYWTMDAIDAVRDSSGVWHRDTKTLQQAASRWQR